MPLAAGTRLGPYKVLSPLGSGSMGEVYGARSLPLPGSSRAPFLSDAPSRVNGRPPLTEAIVSRRRVSGGALSPDTAGSTSIVTSENPRLAVTHQVYTVADVMWLSSNGTVVPIGTMGTTAGP